MSPSLRRLALSSALACTPAASGDKPGPAASSTAAPADAPLSADERAAATGRIVFLSERQGAAAIDQILPSGQDARTLLRGALLPDGPTLFPGAVSPDGAHILVITVEDQAGQHAERLELRPLPPAGPLGEPLWRSDPAPQVRNPSWAPSGRFFAFEASFTSFRDIYRVDLSPGTPPTLRRLTDHPAGNYEPAVSPDEREVAFVSSRDGNAEVYVMRADGSEPRRLSVGPMDDWGPQWSPDGALIAFLSNRDKVDRIYLCKPDGSEQRRLTRDDAKLDVEAGEAEPTFSPEGRSLIFSTRTGPSRAALRLVDLASGALTELTPGKHSDREPVWAPGGALLVFASDRSGDPELYLMRRDGSGVTRLTESPGADWLPRWSPR